jgi:hypothetical protein
MVEGGVTPEVPAAPNGQTNASPVDGESGALEHRVRRLEDAVATLQDTKPLEERIADRVTRRLRRERGAPPAESSGSLVSAGRQLLPAALSLVRVQADRADEPLHARSVSPRRPWLLLEAYADLRAMVRMFFDPRYRLSWLARVGPLVLIGLIATSWIWLPGTSILPTSFMTLIDKAVDLVLAFFAFKILAREACRYREVVADLPIVPRN